MSDSDNDSLFDLSFFDPADYVTVFSAYFDASENGGFFSVGGLLFRKKNVRPFERQWKRIKTKFKIPYFHTAECNVEKGVFAHMTKAECIECQSMAIDAVAKYAERGATWHLKISDFNEVVGTNGFFPSPYAACVYPAMMYFFNWASKNDDNPRLFYIFESGEANEGDVENLLQSISQDEGRKARFRYADHAFLPKQGSLPTQGADLLAWHSTKHVLRRSNGLTHLRGDFKRLVDSLAVTDGHMDRGFLERLVAWANSHAGSKHGGEFARLSLMLNRSNEKRSMARFHELLRAEGGD